MLFIIGILISFVLITSTILFIKKCQPHCSGSKCGPNMDGCGGSCSCPEGATCINGICCYDQCDGLTAGINKCGNTCYCNRLPNGVPTNDVADSLAKENKTQSCCYSQDCNGYFCGSDGCGGTCDCQEGSTCSNTGICSNSGVKDWKYNVIFSNGMVKGYAKTPEECASWKPESIGINLTNFPCSTNDDCQYGDTCEKDKNGNKFCATPDIYQWWYFEPPNTCTKIKEGSNVCGVPQTGSYGFDVLLNQGPDKIACSNTCNIDAMCDYNSCCPNGWNNKPNSAYCTDSNNKTQCCINNTNLPDYNNCIASNPNCKDISNSWYPGYLAQFQNNICGEKTLIGNPINIKTSDDLNNNFFLDPCNNKNVGDSCQYNDNSTSFTGQCRNCIDGTLKCLPNSFCHSKYKASGTGTCSTQNLCGI